MTDADLAGKRAIVVGAETEAGRMLAPALAEAGCDLALVSATTEAEASFAVKRLARQAAALGRRALAQAIDAANDMAVRVMVRQAAKELGGLDLLFFCADLGDRTGAAFALACRYGSKEMARSGGGVVVGIGDVLDAAAGGQQAAADVRVETVQGGEVTPALIEAALRVASGPEGVD